jgi:hypothetical protein
VPEAGAVVDRWDGRRPCVCRERYPTRQALTAGAGQAIVAVESGKAERAQWLNPSARDPDPRPLLVRSRRWFYS